MTIGAVLNDKATRKFQIDEIARIFRVPPHMVGDLDKSSFSNIEQQSLEFVKYTLDPWVSRWEQSITRRLFSAEDKKKYFIKFNVDGLEFDGDVKKIRHVLYNCTASRPRIESQTNEEDVEVQTETLSLTASPLANGYVKAKTGDNTTDAVYRSWYASVYLPQETAEATLSALTIGVLELSPAFDPDAMTYTAATSNATDTITATVRDSDATVAITVNGEEHANGTAATWETGENTVVITVTNGSTVKTYTVAVTKEE